MSLTVSVTSLVRSYFPYISGGYIILAVIYFWNNILNTFGKKGGY